MKTFLFIRCSRLAHCQSMLQMLRQSHHPDGDTHWIWILQPYVEKQMLQGWEQANVDICLYDDPEFTYRRLMELFGEKFRQNRIEMAYVPFNNAEGGGYFQIIKFLTDLGIPKIVVQTPDGPFETYTLLMVALRRVKEAMIWILETIILILLIPFLGLYYFLKSIGRRLCRLFNMPYSG